jgi:DNA-binding MarR family transcriptional regulator
MSIESKLSESVGSLLKLKGQCYLNLVGELDISDLTLKQISYLKQLNKSCGVTTSQLAETLDLSKPTVTEMIKKFIKWGYVYKQSCPMDGRVYYLKLTDKGQMIATLEPLTHDFLAKKLLAILSEEDVEQLISILEKIV